MSEITLVDDLDSQYTTYNFNTDPSHFLEPIDIAIETIMATRGSNIQLCQAPLATRINGEVVVEVEYAFGGGEPSKGNFKTKGKLSDPNGNFAQGQLGVDHTGRKKFSGKAGKEFEFETHPKKK